MAFLLLAFVDDRAGSGRLFSVHARLEDSCRRPERAPAFSAGHGG